MTEEIISKAIELRGNIARCKAVLEADIDYFAGVQYPTIYTSRSIYHSLPETLNDDIKELIKERLKQYKQELQNL